MERGHPAAIEVEQLQVGYGRTVVLNGMELAVSTGRHFGLLRLRQDDAVRTIAGFKSTARLEPSL